MIYPTIEHTIASFIRPEKDRRNIADLIDYRLLHRTKDSITHPIIRALSEWIISNKFGE